MATKVSINFVASVTSALTGIGKVYAATKKLSSQAHKMGAGLTNFGQSMVRNVTVPITAGLGLATKEAVSFEKELINASRALDFTESQIKAFSKTARAIAPSLGLMPEAFANLAAEAGKLGIEANNIEQFAINTAKFAAATDTNATLLAQRLAAIRSVYGSTNNGLLKFSAIVNLLDDKVGGTAADILQFTTRLAGVGKTAGLTAEQIAAIGATFLKLGRNVSDAGTGTNTLLVNLVSATRLSKRAQAGFRELGTSAEEVQRWMRTNPQEGLLRFLRLANEFQGDRLGVLTDVFGRQHAPKVAALAEAYQELARAFKLSTQTQTALNKLNAETEKRLNSSAGQLAIFRAQMSNLGITIGTALLPALNSILKTITPLIVKFARWAEANPKLLEMGLIIAGITAVIAPLLIAVGSVISAVSAIAPVIAVVVGGIGAVGGAIGAFVGSPIVLILGAIAAVVASAWWLANNWDSVGTHLANLWGGLKRGASDLWQAFVNDPVARAAVTLWRNASQGIVASLAWVGDSIKWVIDRFHQLPQGINQGTQAFLNVLNHFFTRTVPSFFQRIGNWFMEAGKYLMLTFARGIQSKINEALRPIIDFTNRVRSYLPGSDAKVGALSDLTRAGKALLDTVAQGITDRRLVGNVELGVQNARNAIAFPNTAPVSNNNSAITINFAPTIQAGSEENGRRIVDELRPYVRELIEMIQRGQNRVTRGTF